MTDHTDNRALIDRVEHELIAETLPPDPTASVRIQTIRDLIDALATAQAKIEALEAERDAWKERAAPSDCEAGCVALSGGDRRHDRNCVHYPESRTKLCDDMMAARDYAWNGALRELKAKFTTEPWSWNRKEIHDKIDALIDAPAPAPVRSLQDRVAPWMDACFGPEISADKLERGDRFLEEALELLQSGNYPRERIASLVEYVYSRDKGEPAQEVGGVMITLAAYCLAHGLDMHEAGEAELARIWTKVDKIRAKQAAKPVGSALPIPAPAQPSVQEAARELINTRMSTYRAKNGRQVSIEGDDGEKCWIVPFEEMDALERALVSEDQT